jgi:diguanylate cyclase (GGDEF) domain
MCRLFNCRIDGKKLKEVGKVGTNASEHETGLKTVTVPFIPTSSTVEIAVQVSSYGEIRGGFSAAPIIGDLDTLERLHLSGRYLTVLVEAIIFIVGIATLTIGLMNRNEKMFLAFGLFAIGIAVRGLVTVPYLYNDLPFSISYLAASRVEYISTSISFALYALFIYFLYNKLFSRKIIIANLVVFLSIAVLSTFTEPKVFHTLFFSAFPFAMFFIFYNIWIMYKALKLKLDLAKSLLLGILFVIVGYIGEYFNALGFIYSPPIANPMIMINVLLVLFSLCRSYVNHVDRLKVLNSKLDELVKERTLQLNQANEELKRQVNLDSLTGIYNRHKFNATISENFETAARHNECLSIILLDIDEYKKYNDYYGHVQGDELLFRIAQLIKQLLPDDVTFARYGGEEFAIILPGYSLQASQRIAEEIRRTVEHERMESLGRDSGIVTVSIGCAERMADQIRDEKELTTVSDERLYMSKALGRNRVTAASQST